MIEVKGTNGESLLLDGATLTKYRHNGMQEAARNPVSTFREARVTPKKRKGDAEQHYDVLMACSAFFSLTVPESQKPALDRLVAQLQATVG